MWSNLIYYIQTGKQLASSIIKGWFNYLTKKNNKLRIDRLNVCELCPSKKGSWCGECGCYLKAKASLEDSFCDLGKWQ